MIGRKVGLLSESRQGESVFGEVRGKTGRTLLCESGAKFGLRRSGRCYANREWAKFGLRLRERFYANSGRSSGYEGAGVFM